MQNYKKIFAQKKKNTQRITDEILQRSDYSNVNLCNNLTLSSISLATDINNVILGVKGLWPGTGIGVGGTATLA